MHHDLSVLLPRPDLSPKLMRLLSESFAAKTLEAYALAWRRWLRWAEPRGHETLPAEDSVLLEHIGDNVHRLSHSTLSIAVAGIRAVHELAGLPTRPTRSRELRKILRVAYRRGAPLGQVTGIDWAVADGIVAACMARPDDLRSIRDAALIAIMSDGLLRIGEACALRVDDIGRCDGGTGLVVVRSSKTDQAGVGAALHLRASTVAVLDAWFEAAAIRVGFVFRPLRGRAALEGPCSRESVRAAIQRRARAHGVRGRVSGHSLRVGSAQSLVLAGATLPGVMLAGRWSSPELPAHYARAAVAAQGAVAVLRSDVGSPS